MCNQEIVDEAKTLWDKLMGPKARAPKGASKVWPKGQFASRETDAPAGCTLVLPTFHCHDCVFAGSVDKGVARTLRAGARATRARRGTRLSSRAIVTFAVSTATRQPTAPGTVR